MIENMTRYVTSHWHGKHSLAKSVFVNGLAAYVILVVGFVSIGQFVRSQLFVIVGLLVFLLWSVWATVGILRCAMKTTVRSDATLLSRLFGILAVICVIVATVYAALDLWSLYLSP
jgi:hypothetical protein